ncbi:MAG: hypothetical protein U0325_25240 [Polyangiales bacterium]
MARGPSPPSRSTDRDDERIGSTPRIAGRRRPRGHRSRAAPEEHPLRILVATDAAREGINLQAACADLFTSACRGTPRIEQRNGRIDRMLQPKDKVRCHYFRYRNLPEDAVLACLAQKSHDIENQLGSFTPVSTARIVAALEKGCRARRSRRRRPRRRRGAP